MTHAVFLIRAGISLAILGVLPLMPSLGHLGGYQAATPVKVTQVMPRPAPQTRSVHSTIAKK